MNDDVFVSYVYADRARWAELMSAVRTSGVRLFQDYESVDTFESITARIRDALPKCRVVLVLWSKAYPTRRACQWELTAAYLAAQKLGEVRDRILVVRAPDVNPDEVRLPELRDSVFGEASSPDHIVGRIKSILATVRTPLGAPDERWPAWYPGALRPRRPDLFVGRAEELWQLHLELSGDKTTLTTGRDGRDQAIVIGLPGSGKTMLVQEYAMRFRAAFPGGVLWHRVASKSADRHSTWVSLLLEVASTLGLADMDERSVALSVFQHFRSSGLRMLWVVDDVADDCTVEQVKHWMAPPDIGATILIARTRSLTYALGGTVDVSGLPSDAAFELLTRQNVPQTENERRAAAAIAARLGGHALALAVVGAYLRRTPGVSFDGYDTKLGKCDRDHLARTERIAAAVMKVQLPTGHDVLVTAAILGVIESLGSASRLTLAYLSQLSVEPVPISLVESALIRAGSGDPQEVRELVEEGLLDADAVCLVSPLGSAVLLHQLVSRTARFALTDLVGDDAHAHLLAAADAAAIRGLKARSYEDLRACLPHLQHLLDDVAPASAFVDAGMAAEFIGLLTTATNLLEQAVHLTPPDHSDYPRALDRLASVYKDVGRLPDARRVHGILKDLFDAGDLRISAVIARNVATTLVLTGEIEEANRLMDGAATQLRAAEKFGGLPDVISALADSALAPGTADPNAEFTHLVATELHQSHIQAQIAEKRGDRQAAIQLLIKAKEAARVLGSAHPEFLALQHELGRMYVEEGDFGLAVEENGTVFEARKRSPGEDHYLTLRAGHNFGRSLHGMGRDQEAAEVLRWVVERKVRLLPEGDESILISVQCLCQALSALQQYAEYSALSSAFTKFGWEFHILAIDAAIGDGAPSSHLKLAVGGFLDSRPADEDELTAPGLLLMNLPHLLATRLAGIAAAEAMFEVQHALLEVLADRPGSERTRAFLGRALVMGLVAAGALIKGDAFRYVTSRHFGGRLDWPGRL